MKRLFLFSIILLYSCSSSLNEKTVLIRPVWEGIGGGVEISSPSTDSRIFLNISNDSREFFPEDLNKNDILVINFLPWGGSRDWEFYNEFPGKKIIVEDTEYITEDFKIKLVQSKYGDDSVFKEKGGAYMTIVEINGIKIVHAGHTSQTSFEPFQMEAIRDADIYIGFITNFADDPWLNTHRVDLVRQLKPKLWIPIAFTIEKFNENKQEFPSFVYHNENGIFQFNAENIDKIDETTVLVLTDNGKAMKSYYNLEDYPGNL